VDANRITRRSWHRWVPQLAFGELDGRSRGRGPGGHLWLVLVSMAPPAGMDRGQCAANPGQRNAGDCCVGLRLFAGSSFPKPGFMLPPSASSRKIGCIHAGARRRSWRRRRRGQVHIPTTLEFSYRKLGLMHRDERYQLHAPGAARRHPPYGFFPWVPHGHRRTRKSGGRSVRGARAGPVELRFLTSPSGGLVRGVDRGGDRRPRESNRGE